MSGKSGPSGDHDPTWGTMGFLASPEDRALGMLVAEAAEMNYKALVMRLLRDAAFDAGILDADNQIRPEFKTKYEFYVERARMKRGRRPAEKKGNDKR